MNKYKIYGGRKQIYFRTVEGQNELQLIEQKLGREVTSRDLIEALAEKLNLTLPN